MNQSELVAAVSSDSGIAKKDVEAVIKSLANTTHAALAKSDEVTIPGICKITCNLRPGRPGKNPRTGEQIQIAAKYVPKIKALKALNDAAAVEV